MLSDAYAIPPPAKRSTKIICFQLFRLADRFLFVTLGLYADNGMEYLGHKADKLLDKLCIKSQSRLSNANSLAESKNAAVMRKRIN